VGFDKEGFLCYDILKVTVGINLFGATNHI